MHDTLRNGTVSHKNSNDDVGYEGLFLASLMFARSLIEFVAFVLFLVFVFLVVRSFLSNIRHGLDQAGLLVDKDADTVPSKIHGNGRVFRQDVNVQH
jgi:hypothetical protein